MGVKLTKGIFLIIMKMFLSRLFLIFVCGIIILEHNGGKMANATVGKIETMALQSTVKIENSNGGIGTGFIVSKAASTGGRYFFLVTNKHLIGEYSLIEGKIKDFYDDVTFFVYRKDGSVQGIRVSLKDKDGKVNIGKVLLYPKPYIDLVVISIADDLIKVADIDMISFDLDYLASNEKLEQWSVNIGDQVFALGYSYNIYSTSNNYPIAKSGYIASKTGEEITVKVHYKDERGTLVSHELKGKLILLDGTFVEGNSGGPIFIPRGRRERTMADTAKVELSTTSAPNLIIGIQSQSLTKAGLSFAFSSEYIIELINKVVGLSEEHQNK